MKMKFKVGDKVKVLEGDHKGKVSIIEDVDPEWQHPYSLEGISELFNDDELELYIEDSKNEIKEPEEKPDVESEQSDVDDFYLVVYNPVDGRTLLFDPDGKLLIDDKFNVEPKENAYFMGFFDGLSHGGVKFVIKLQYLSQNKED